MAHWFGKWTSVKTGIPTFSFTAERISNPSSKPGPRNASPDVRFALSKEFLNTKGSPTLEHSFAIASAINNECSLLSMTQGPAIMGKASPPKETLPV